MVGGPSTWKTWPLYAAPSPPSHKASLALQKLSAPPLFGLGKARKGAIWEGGRWGVGWEEVCKGFSPVLTESGEGGITGPFQGGRAGQAERGPIQGPLPLGSCRGKLGAPPLSSEAARPLLFLPLGASASRVGGCRVAGGAEAEKRRGLNWGLSKATQPGAPSAPFVLLILRPLWAAGVPGCQPEGGRKAGPGDGS